MSKPKAVHRRSDRRPPLRVFFEVPELSFHCGRDVNHPSFKRACELAKLSGCDAVWEWHASGSELDMVQIYALRGVPPRWEKVDMDSGVCTCGQCPP